MKTEAFHLELITPCFCAGADQAKAEIRASSIRGQLRWWFRALGGSAENELEIFGGIAARPVSSAIQVRVGAVTRGPEWMPPNIDPNSMDSYVWYFASVSGKAPGRGRKEKGPRWSSQGAIPPRSRFTIEIVHRRLLSEKVEKMFDSALSCFLQLGGLGLRVTRGLGSFVCDERSYSPAILKDLALAGFRSESRLSHLASVDAVATEIGALVKGTRNQQGWQATDKKTVPSPFGSSVNPRQTSAVYFRPVRVAPTSSNMHIIVFEAPQARVLGRESRKPSVVGFSPSKLLKAQPRRAFRR